jgi:hypothetical protein
MQEKSFAITRNDMYISNTKIKSKLADASMFPPDAQKENSPPAFATVHRTIMM